MLYAQKRALAYYCLAKTIVMVPIVVSVIETVSWFPEIAYVPVSAPVVPVVVVISLLPLVAHVPVVVSRVTGVFK